MNQPLQRRVGNNIGVSPIGPSSAYQQHVNAPVLTLADDETVLWEPAPGVVRVPGGNKPVYPGLLVTDDLALGDVEVDLIFIDGDDREFFVGEGILPTGDGAAPMIMDGIGGKLGYSPLGLCPTAGEKIVARVRSATLPAGKVRVIPYSKDWKVKGAGRGGLSDGGVRCMRGVVTSQGVDFAPRAGTSWEPLGVFGSIYGGGGMSLFLSNPDLINLARVQVCHVAPDGTEYPINTPANTLGIIDVLQGALVDVVALINDWAIENRTFIQYPSKLRVKLYTDNTSTGPVGALLMVGENDVAPDLAQEAS